LSEELDRLLVGLTASSNKTRLGILIALFDSMATESVGTNSLSFTELREVFELNKSELSYHLDILKKANFVSRNIIERPTKRRYTAYELTEPAIQFLDKLGITEETIKRYRTKAETKQ